MGMDGDTYVVQHGDHKLSIQRSSVRTGDAEGVTMYDAMMQDDTGEIGEAKARITKEEADNLIEEWEDPYGDLCFEPDSVMGKYFSSYRP